MKKLPPGAETSNILVGELNNLEKPIPCFIRLQEVSMLGDLTEVPVPTRFIFILLGPGVSKDIQLHLDRRFYSDFQLPEKGPKFIFNSYFTGRRQN